jgi:hypothetical protein
MKKKLFAIGCAALTIIMAAGCGKLDVVGQNSIPTFDAVLQAVPERAVFDDVNGGWSLAAPDKMARFVWSRDWSASPLHDVMLVFDAAPFIAAGLDGDKLPDSIAFFDDMLMVGTKLGNEKLTYKGEATPLASYEQVVSLSRKSIGYHGALDHYGVSLGDGNMFEWAKDMSTNDKDMVFVLNPAPFIAAGVDPNKVEGWVFGKVTVDDENGKPIEVDKLLKPFNLK